MPSHEAYSLGAEDVVRYLLNNGANKPLKDIVGFVPEELDDTRNKYGDEDLLFSVQSSAKMEKQISLFSTVCCITLDILPDPNPNYGTH
jgi:ankyrin repeat protein